MKDLDDMQNKTPFGHIILWLGMLFIACALVWAYYAELDEVTSGTGKIVPSQKVQVIQNLEGGIVKKILVREGQVVKKGQTLMFLDDVAFASDVRANKRQRLELAIKISRLKAQINNRSFRPSAHYKKQAPELVRAQQQIFNIQQQSIGFLKRRLSLLNKEYRMTKPSVRSGAVSEVELLRLEQSIQEIKGQVVAKRSENAKELESTITKLTQLAEESKKHQDRLKRTAIISPVKGIIKQVFVTTEGGVIKAGMAMMEIVPLEDTLLVEAKIRPDNIGFIKKGMNAMVKITAYDYSIYGGLQGKVEHISADTSVDEDGNSYYEVWVRTDRSYLERHGHKLRIIPGMQASISILTGKKTVLDYILKPILKAKSKALSER